jgi:hypothetical protein
MAEQWKKISDYNYEISDLGRLRNIASQKITTGSITRNGYVTVALSNNGKAKYMSLHRLVADLFVPNPDHKTQVNHIISKTDNRACALEWSTPSENASHAHREIIQHATKSVDRLDNDGTIIKTYQKLEDVRVDGFDPRGVSAVAHGRRKVHAGFCWKFTNEEPPDCNADDEQWQPLEQSEDDTVRRFTRYAVSNYGRVKEVKTGKLRKIGKDGRLSICNGVKDTRMFLVHRLMLLAFNVKNPDNKPEVDHIDSDPTNNKLSNLRWATKHENMMNENTRQKISDARRATHKGKIQIHVTSNNWIDVKFTTRQELMNAMKLDYRTIKKYINTGEWYRNYLFSSIQSNPSSSSSSESEDSSSDD